MPRKKEKARHAPVARSKQKNRTGIFEKFSSDIKQKYQILIENSPDNICILDKEATILFINRVLPQFRIEDIVGTSGLQYISDDQRAEYLDLLGKLFDTGEHFSMELRMVGPSVWLSRLVPIRRNGKVEFAMAISSDITEQKTAENKLVESYQLIKAITEGTSDSIYLRNLKGDFLMMNSSAARYFGKTPDQIIGKNVNELFNPEIVNKIKKADEETFLTGKTISYEHHMEIDGNPYIFLTSRGPIRNRENSITGFFGVSHDITDLKKKEEDQVRHEKLESLGLLAGGIAHDFNNILTAILGNISLAKARTAAFEDIVLILNEAEKASLRAKELSNQLLTFAKGGNPNKIATSIADILVDSSEFVLRGTNVKARFEIPGQLWPVEVDEGQISQVIQNLVINARQSMPKGGIIEIKAENCRVTPDTKEDPFVKSGEYVKIQVKDAGSGIPKEMLQRIFDPYFTTKEKGTGLGLAISYSIIKRHNGYITARSLPGDGTVFAILLPAIPGYSAPAKDNPTGLVKGKGRILLMDDEEAVLKTGGECLRYLGYDVECSSDGNEAVQKYKKSCDLREPFDLVILDLTVPGGLSGQETMQKLIEVDPRVKGIVSSGYSDSVILSEFRKFGFVGKISKPYRIEELSRALSMALGR